ncbi:MAG: DUF58 domain-containing protein [Kiritimatiellaeota bacterium]|nr:DUF58 domain-containing protein [Kiritimatiellota bacterium]
MPLTPTTRGKILISFTIASFFVAMVNPNIATALVFSVAFALLAASFLLSIFSLSGVTCALDVCPDGTMNESLCLPLTVRNKSWRGHQGALARFELPFSAKKYDEFEIFPVKGRGVEVVDCFIVPQARGLFRIKKIKLVGGDPAGIFSRVKKFKIAAEIKIYPQTMRLESLHLQSRNKIKSSTDGRTIGISGDGQDIFGLREYRPGDPVRMIHWKASARQERLLVKEFESLRLDRVTILLDSHSKSVGEDEFDNNFEFLVKTAASMARHLAGLYCHLSFITFDAENGGLVSITGASSGISRDMTELLATIKPDTARLSEPLWHAVDIVPPDSILFCLTMSFDDKVSECFNELAANGVDIRWIFAPPSGFPNRVSPPPPNRKRKFDFSNFPVSPQVVSSEMNVSRALGAF